MSVRPPRPRGPHLNAMRAFEAAARLGGFAAAAEELSVTAGAVSQQVKALEDWIGAPLFERRSQGVVLTELGAAVVGDFVEAFDALGGALHRLRAEAPKTTVHIAALPAIAQLWLSPRLPALREALPGQAISITAMEQPPNLAREIFDISLFITDVAHAAALVLAEDRILPVCAPSLATRLATPADLANETLLHDSVWHGDWPSWLAMVGLPVDLGRNGPVFSLYSIAVEEAKNGAGVLIGHEPLVRSLLQSGTLVAPFAQTCHSGKSLVLETAEPTRGCRHIRRIVDLLAKHEFPRDR